MAGKGKNQGSQRQVSFRGDSLTSALREHQPSYLVLTEERQVFAHEIAQHMYVVAQTHFNNQCSQIFSISNSVVHGRYSGDTFTLPN